ncbi:hypothetical protein [Roseinatronobacter sp. NSM]|uniref:hypothetical protein n=1 Tax=Roseinatronobacter sp. NSM TaxID=3457785 RepID=UPI0040352540
MDKKTQTPRYTTELNDQRSDNSNEFKLVRAADQGPNVHKSIRGIDFPKDADLPCAADCPIPPYARAAIARYRDLARDRAKQNAHDLIKLKQVYQKISVRYAFTRLAPISCSEPMPTSCLNFPLPARSPCGSLNWPTDHYRGSMTLCAAFALLPFTQGAAFVTDGLW